MTPSRLSRAEFVWFRDFLKTRTGIVLNDSKEQLVVGRLDKRLRALGLDSFGEYFSRLGLPEHEVETELAMDLLTTNETYFFREPKHFEFLRTTVLPELPVHRPLRAWSAASSSGEEAYTLAMSFSEHFRGEFEIVGTDISTRMVEKASRGLYPIQAMEKIPLELLKRHCLRGTEEYDGLLMMSPALCSKLRFLRANLLQPLPDIGLFDLIFLRNVMIYFDKADKEKLVARAIKHLRPGGYFFVSHSETLSGFQGALKLVRPSIYRLPP